MERDYKEEERPKELRRDQKEAKILGGHSKEEERPSSLTLTSIVFRKWSETGTQRDSSNSGSCYKGLCNNYQEGGE